MKKITIVMPFLNEEEEPLQTLKSIRNTAPDDLYEVIAIDDGSIAPPDLQGFPGVKYVKNTKRLGVDGSRQLGVNLAETPFIFIIDAHMRFKNDKWMERLLECMEREPYTAWCTTCVALGYGTMDMDPNKGKYYGANMLFIDPNAKKGRPAREILEPKWASKKNNVEYDIPCILGANYGFSKQWFNYIKGLYGLKMWGTSEPFLSIKTWLAGGKCKIRTDIEIGHKFRKNAPYRTGVSDLVYNKIFLCKTILPKELGETLIECMPKDINYKKAIKSINGQFEAIESYRKYYNGIFKNTIYEYCQKFDIQLP